MNRNYRSHNLKRVSIAFGLACGLIAFGNTTQAQELYGVTGSGGSPSATLHIINQTDASVTPVLALNDNNGGQVIAFNPDDRCMYHWTGYPAPNALFERIDLSTNSVTNIPLSGFQTSEIFSATYDPVIGAFLTSDLSFNLGSVTADGFRTNIGTTSQWVRGLAFVGDTLYGGHNSLIPVDELYTIDPTNGNFFSTTQVTLDGYSVAGFAGQATNPETGQLWAVLLVEELPRKTRILATIDPATGVATLIGILPAGSGFSSIAFVSEPVVTVEIDIKPGSDRNPINPRSRGVFPVAIFSTEDFDATMIDPPTVELAGVPVAVRGRRFMAHEEDVNEDGLIDLVCQFETEGFEDLESGEVCLTGTTYDGERIQGCDIILIVPPED